MSNWRSSSKTAAADATSKPHDEIVQPDLDWLGLLWVGRSDDGIVFEKLWERSLVG